MGRSFSMGSLTSNTPSYPKTSTLIRLAISLSPMEEIDEIERSEVELLESAGSEPWEKSLPNAIRDVAMV